MNYFLVDAFTLPDQPFSGNPAVIIPLADADAWPCDDWMQSLAMEFNLSETAFFAPQPDGAFRLRWFTPTTEVDLCGHATLAAAHVAYAHLGLTSPSIRFESRSGPLVVTQLEDTLQMDFPARPATPAETDIDRLSAMLGARPTALYVGANYLAVFESEAEVAALNPDMRALATLEERRGCIATAPGNSADFVSRYFVPAAGVDEDPVTGSAHCMLTPYWANTLDQPNLVARQISQRGGLLQCGLRGDRVLLSGQAHTVATGQLQLTP